MKTGLLSNSSLAIPALQQLITQSRLHKIGIPLPYREVTQGIAQIASRLQVPLTTFTKKGLSGQLDTWCEGLDVVIVIGFPWKIPADSLKQPVHGFFNFHFAPLPRYRGAAPLFWVLKEQEKTNQLCIHRMTAELDEGNILFQASLPLSLTDTLGQHMGKLSMANVEWTQTFLRQLAAGQLEDTPQDSAQARYWPTPGPDDLTIRWQQQDTAQVQALVKASNPHYGGAICSYQGFPFRILEVTNVINNQLPPNLPPGTILNSPEVRDLFVYCKGPGLLRLDVIRLEEGYFPGWKLFELGVQAGTCFS